MGACYTKLWNLLIDRDMIKRDLSRLAKISPTSLAKLGKGENVNTDILVCICNVLSCDMGDIVEVTHDEKDVM